MNQYRIRQYEEGYRYKTTSQPTLLILYILQGELLLSSPSKWVRLGQGFVGVFPKGASFHLECTKSFRGLYLFFEDEQKCVGLQEASGVEGDTAAKVIAELLRLELLKENLSEKILHSLGQTFVELTCRLFVESSSASHSIKDSNVHVQKAIQKMQDSLYSKMPVESILAGCGVGYRQISRHFKEKKGDSPKQVFIQLKMQEVCRLLTETKFSVTTIAHELGFASSQHLSTQFKTIFGSTPRKWRWGEGIREQGIGNRE